MILGGEIVLQDGRAALRADVGVLGASDAHLRFNVRHRIVKETPGAIEREKGQVELVKLTTAFTMLVETSSMHHGDTLGRKRLRIFKKQLTIEDPGA